MHHFNRTTSQPKGYRPHRACLRPSDQFINRGRNKPTLLQLFNCHHYPQPSNIIPNPGAPRFHS